MKPDFSLAQHSYRPRRKILKASAHRFYKKLSGKCTQSLVILHYVVLEVYILAFESLT